MKSNKPESTYKTIGQVAKELGLVNKKTGHIQTHTLRYWEKQFKEIKPTIRAGNRRYYSRKNFEMIKMVKFLLKEKGLTIIGAKKILSNPKSEHLDEDIKLSLYRPELKNSNVIKNKLKNISKIIKELKKLK
tara:strand:+ start:27 stop:422 length:396 start_codon:yes stop_codon:yes gene_type:complete